MAFSFEIASSKSFIRGLDFTEGRAISYVSSQIEEEVGQIVRLSQDVALQLGINLEQLQLRFLGQDNRVHISDAYRDCEDGDLNRGFTYTVDLLIMPGLQKPTEDGLSEGMHRILVPCDIYPKE